MISRVAEDCFWLMRYLERVETLARLQHVNLAFQLDSDVRAERWRPLVVVTGEEGSFLELVGADAIDDGHAVREFLTWSPDSPASIRSSLHSARENARTLREVVSLEMWETLNELWLWLGSRAARRLYEREPHAFYTRVRDQCVLVHGFAQTTILLEEAFDFMRLGTVLERASETARILDVKYHGIGPTRLDAESPDEVAEWLAVLRFCSAIEPFSKRSGHTLSGPAVAEFLLFERSFPRSVVHNLDRARNFLELVRAPAPPEIGRESARQLGKLLEAVEALSIEEVLERSVHDVLTWIVDSTAELCAAVERDFFRRGHSQSQSQSQSPAPFQTQSQSFEVTASVQRETGEAHVSQLLGLSFDCEASPSIVLQGLEHHAERVGRGDLPYGWGFGWYPGDGTAGVLVKDPTSVGESEMTRLLRDWERFRSSTFVCHLRGAAQRITQRDTQPFMKSYGGRNWILAHSGDLKGDWQTALPLGDNPSFEPLGRTDSEHLFGWLLAQLEAARARTLAELGYEALHTLLRRANELGTLDLLLSDGQDLVAYGDAGAVANGRGLHWLQSLPPHPTRHFESPDVSVDIADRDAARSAFLVSARPLSEGAWQPVAPGQLLVARRGALAWNSHEQQPSTHQQAARFRQARAAATPDQPRAWGSQSRVLRVVHTTTYRYDGPIENSTHVFRLQPVRDDHQDVLESAVDCSVEGLRRDYEDVFGNRVSALDVSTPFTELRVESRSLVRVHPPAVGLVSPFRRTQIPLVWMPWQRQMMLPYLLPLELPETELQELSRYAMSFVDRNDSELIETLLDMNTTLYRDYTYVPGSTHIETTPFQLYVSRTGVCQDFANLFICLARLLSIPARYRVGYIFTGATYENPIQSEASHAWVELYLPWTGWRGFDPTNGCLVSRDHVRVACGRNYRDATPTSGTIFKGPGHTETLGVDVRVEEA